MKVELLDVMVKLGVDIDAQDIGSNDCNTIGFSALHYTYYYRSYMTRAHFQRCMQSHANEPSIYSWSGAFLSLAGDSTQAQEVHRIRKG